MPFINARGNTITPPDAVDVPVDLFEETPDLTHPALRLDFESYVDGRAFSIAGLLRSEGYAGVLVGTGEIGLDRLAYGFRAGFDLLWLSEVEHRQLTTIHLAPFPQHYQIDLGVAS